MTIIFPIEKARKLPRFTIHKYTTLDNYRNKNRRPRGKAFLRLSLIEWKYHGDKFIEDVQLAQDFIDTITV